MFSHLIKYMSRIMYKNRDGVTFGLIFPLAFGIIYLFVFTGLLSGGYTLETLPVAIVFEGTTAEVDSARNIVASIAVPGEVVELEVVAVDKASDSDEAPLLTYIEASPTKAQELVDQNIIDAIITIDNTDHQLLIALEVAPVAINHYSSSIIHSALSSLIKINHGVQVAIEDLPGSDNLITSIVQIEQRLSVLEDTPTYVAEANAAKGTSSFSIYFYASLAYVCIFFMGMGTNMVTENEANYSMQALRATLAPIPKYKRFFASFVSWSLPSLAIMYLLIFIFYQNGVPLGHDWLRITLVITLGVLVGLLLGTTLASVLKAKPSFLTATSIGLPLVFGALSGMMAQELKVFINDSASWLNKINPVSLISDAIYFLNNYPTLKQYNQNIMILMAYIVVLLTITLIALRRTDYENL